jgi:mercuric ion transport protein
MSELPYSRYFLFVSGLGAALASLCCLGPLLLLALGFSGAWLANLTLLEPYRPFFIGLSLLALLFAGQLIFRSTPGCQHGESCSQSPKRKRSTTLFWVVSTLILLALIIPYFLPWFY